MPNLTHEDLVAVLHLSTMWELVKVIVLGICIQTCSLSWWCVRFVKP
jgi:hypothetical protein